ncbi:MAG: hypothetical protein CMC07_01515 [Flavobacteriaceae bacterium]|nr:hypothetical protein [Flavobacteriaceae bacterium]HBY70056.1 hypothetical protein [Flavobacteriaceae bacterium]
MSKKLYISLLILFISFVTISQTRPCTIYLKSGETITDMRGYSNNKYFKYYKKVGDRFNKIKLEKIESVSLEDKSGNITKLRFLPVKGKKRIQNVEEVVLGELELYRKLIAGYNTASYFQYYIRKKSQDKLTLIGHDSFGNKKKKPILYPFLENCPELIKKIENEDFHIVRDLSLIIGTYNITCALNKD